MTAENEPEGVSAMLIRLLSHSKPMLRLAMLSVMSLYFIGLAFFLYVRFGNLDQRQRTASEEITRRIEALKEPEVTDSREKIRRELLRPAYFRRYLFLDSKQVEDQYSKFGGKAILVAADIEYTTASKVQRVHNFGSS